MNFLQDLGNNGMWTGGPGGGVDFAPGTYFGGGLVISTVPTPEPETQFLTLAGFLLLGSGLCLKRGSLPRRVAEP